MKTSTSNSGNSRFNGLKLFGAIVVSIASIMATTYLVQQTVVAPEAEAATTVNYGITVKPNYGKSGCNAKIGSYKIIATYSKINKSTSVIVRKNDTAARTLKVSGPSTSGVVVSVKASAIDNNGYPIGRTLTVYGGSGVAPGQTISKSVTIPCSGY